MFVVSAISIIGIRFVDWYFMRNIYLDYAASTPVDASVLDAMQPYFSEKFGNPGSLHSFGQEAIGAVDEARQTIARSLVVGPRQIIFAGSATEANNLAIRGVVKFLKERSKLWGIERPHIITSAIEHESILETCRDLEQSGEAEVSYVPVTKEGFVRLSQIEEALRPETALVSIQYENNEIGTIQPIKEIAELLEKFRRAKPREESSHATVKWQAVEASLPLLHTDAVQAFQFLDCSQDALGVDLATISAHKIYGPKGIGALSVRDFGGIYPLEPLTTGGGQEYGLRSGTENVPLIVGFGKAIELAVKEREIRRVHIQELRKHFIDGLKRICPQAHFNGPLENNASPHIVNVSFPGFDSEFLLIRLDQEGIAVSSGSACRARAIEPSYVLKAMGLEESLLHSNIRFSFGAPSTQDEIDKTLSRLSKILQKSAKL